MCVQGHLSVQNRIIQKRNHNFSVRTIYIYKTEKYNEVRSYSDFLKLTDTLHFGAIVILSD